MTSQMAPVMATASRAPPAITSWLARKIRFSLSCVRNAIRCWIEGAIRQADAAAAHRSVPR